MKKDKIWLFIIIAILIGIGLGTLVKWQVNNRIEANSTLPEISVGSTPNDNGGNLYLIDGIIEKIYSVQPFKIDVKVRVYKFLPDQEGKEIVKTILAKEDTQFILHNLGKNKDSIIEPSLFMVDDDIAIWIAEPNSDIFKLDQLTATKIIKYQ